MTIELVDTRDAWDEIAEGYDATNTPTQMWLGNEALRRAGLRAGMRFLDVAAGSGALAIPAARLGARVLATDRSPVMLELLRRRADEEGLAIETRCMDGHALALEDASFDMAGSQFGVMLFPDMPKGVAEMARVVRPGGRVLMIAYGDPHAIDFIGFFVAAVRTVRPDFDGPPNDPPPLPFQLQDPERLAGKLQAAGLADATVETITETTAFRSGDELLGVGDLEQPPSWGSARRTGPVGRRARLRASGAGGTRPQPRRGQHGAPDQPGQHRHRHQGGNYPALAERARPLTASPPRHDQVAP